MSEIIKDYDTMPERAFFLDADGKFIETPTTEKVSLQKYWAEKTQLLGVLMIVSCMLLLIILLGESNLIQNAINLFFSLLGGLLG